MNHLSEIVFYGFLSLFCFWMLINPKDVKRSSMMKDNSWDDVFEHNQSHRHDCDNSCFDD